MAQTTTNSHVWDNPEINEYQLIDPETDTPEGHTIWKLPKDCDEGRAYAKLSTYDERVGYMRQHHQAESKIALAQWSFYVDLEEGKRYSIRINSPEGETVRRLQGEDSDVEIEQDSEQMDALGKYYKAHAHKVEPLYE